MHISIDIVTMIMIAEDIINSREGNGGLERVAGGETQITVNTVYLFMNSH